MLEQEYEEESMESLDIIEENDDIELKAGVSGWSITIVAHSL